jgi:YidC/Oxa1 family membrane protein insertase
MSIILKPFALLLGWLYTITNSYGLAIILFCLIFKVILFPISIKGRKGMLDMSRLSDKQKELQQKYGRDRAKYSEELQNLYTNENVKPSGGCLWSFLPLPILMALYGIISQPFTHLMGLNKDQIAQLTNFIVGNNGGIRANAQLSIAQRVHENFSAVQANLPDIAGQIQRAGGPVNFNFFGVNMSATPDLLFFQKDGAFTWVNISLFLVPIVSAIFAFLSMKVSMGINKRILGTTTQQDATNRQMMIMQPLISLWLGFTLPAALGVYWIANSVFAILQEYCSIGILRDHVVKTRAEAARRTEEQKEKQKEQKRLAAEQKKQKAEEARRIKMERKVSTDGISESRVGMRAYAKGRTFDQDRYPVTPYHDPDDIIKQQQVATEDANQVSSQKGKKAKQEKQRIEPVSEDLSQHALEEQSVLEEEITEAPETDAMSETKEEKED